jgi:hypothetical protein
MKLFIVFLFLVTGATPGETQSVELRVGQSLIPGDYVAISYQQPTNFPFCFSGRAFLEKSRRNGLNYSAIGIDGLIDYPFGICKLSGGPTVQLESEPWIYQYRSFSARLNYGLVVGASGEIYLTEAFSITAFINQKLLFNQDLGRTSLVFGIGLKYCLSNY